MGASSDTLAALGESLDEDLRDCVRTRAEIVLSGREREVMDLIAEGFSNAEIGARLFITEETVKSHVQHILRKLRARSRAHAVALAREEFHRAR